MPALPGLRANNYEQGIVAPPARRLDRQRLAGASHSPPSRRRSSRRAAGATAQRPYNPRPMPARLILEDGTVYDGEAFGASANSIGEVVFNTSLTGYQEI